MMPRLSVITACFQHGQYLAECIRSVRAQTEKDIEHIIVIDGATDSSDDIATTASHEDDRVIVCRNHRNMGLAYSQNVGILHATGTWVLKVDADDYISPTYAEEILRAADADPRRNVIFSPAHVFGTKEYVYRYPAFNAAKMRDELFIPGPAAFRKSLWREVGGYDETMRSAEDWDLYIRAHLVVGLVPHQLETPLWHYRQHAGVRASEHGMKRLQYLRAYWQGHTRETAMARSRSWGAWCAERKVAA